MKLLPLLILVGAIGAGAVAHRLSSVPQATTAIEVKAPANQQRSPTQENIRIAAALVALGWELDDAVKREEMFSALSPEQFPDVAAELISHGKLGDCLLFWVEKDAQAAMRFVEQNIRSLPQVLWRIAPSCFAREPELFLAVIERLKVAGVEPEQLNSALSHAFENCSNPAEALAAMQKYGYTDKKEKAHWLASVLRPLTAQDPAAAMAFAEKHPDSLETVLSAWSQQQPESVLKWLRARPQASFHPNLLISVLAHIAQQRPQRADELLAMVPRGEGFPEESIYIGLADCYASKPIETVVAWMDALPPEGQRAAYDRLCNELRSGDVGKAAALCLTFPELANEGDTKIALIEWSKRNPTGAIHDYEQGKIPAKIADQILPDLVQSWYQVDRQAALDFVQAQPASEVKGRILVDTSRILNDGDAEACRDYALSLTDPTTRLGACRHVLAKKFYDKSEEEKHAWINSIPDATIRATLLIPPASEPPPAAEDTPSPDQPIADPFAPP